MTFMRKMLIKALFVNFALMHHRALTFM